MKKLNFPSFYFLKIKNKFLFLFILMSVTFLVNGFFINSVNADEIILPLSEDIEIDSTDTPFFTIVDEDILEDTFWGIDRSPYVISMPIQVIEGKTLTIEEGVVVKFDSIGNLTVYGSLDLAGVENNPIYFTSLSDDAILGDTNNDGSNTNPKENKWGGLMIDSVDKSKIKGLVFLYSERPVLFFDGEIDIADSYFDNGISFFATNSNLENIQTSFINLYDGSSLDIKNSKIENDFYWGISVYENSILSVSDSNIWGGVNGGSIYLSNNSNLYLDNVKIKTKDGLGNGLNIYDGFKSKTEIKNSYIDEVKDGILIHNNASVSIYNTTINAFDTGVSLYGESASSYVEDIEQGEYYDEEYEEDEGQEIEERLLVGGSLSILDSSIFGSRFAGVVVYDGTDTIHNVKLRGNQIYDNGFGIASYEAFIDGEYNSFYDNEIGAFNVNDTVNLNLVKNYWGSKTGPLYLSNPYGDGDKITDNISFRPFLTFDPTREVRNPVILIPGITATYLNRNYGDGGEIWPDLGRLLFSPDDSFLNDLILNEDGTENIEYPIVAGDIIRQMATVDVFDGLIKELTNAGYVEGEDLFVFPYDWRFSTKNISILLKDKVEEILSKTNHEKVDIVAHSMGGLVAKKYIADNGEDKIDQLIFLGTPQLGAPKAFKVLMYGDHMGYKFLFMNLSKLRAKIISQNMPSVYELLPSLKYLNINGGYIINSLNESNSIELDYNDTKNYLIDSGRNSQMFTFTEDLHDSVDYLNLSNIKSYNFVGCGNPTIGKITLGQNNSWIGNLFGKKNDYQILYTDGDKTVPLVSANSTIGSEIYYVNGIAHELLPSADGVKENILAILNNEVLFFGDVFQDNNRYCGINGDIVSTHSPVVIHVYDENGNHTGPDEDGNMEYGIDGVVYDTIEDVNYVFLPEGGNYRLITKATEIGGFNLKIEKQKIEEIVSVYNWTLVPQPNISTIGEIFIGTNYEEKNYGLKIDENGDGVFDIIYEEGFDGTSIAEKYVNTINSNKTKIIGHIAVMDFKKEIEKEEFDKIDNKEDADFIDEKVEDSTSNVYEKKHFSKTQKIENSKQEINKEYNKNMKLIASSGGIKNNNKPMLFVFIGAGVLVLLLVIKLIFKIKL